MKIIAKTAIASHLSDAQELLRFRDLKMVNREINYAKAILFKYPDTNVEVEEDELTKICLDVNKRFSPNPAPP